MPLIVALDQPSAILKLPVPIPGLGTAVLATRDGKIPLCIHHGMVRYRAVHLLMVGKIPLCIHS